MEDNKGKTIRLTPLESEILDFLNEENSTIKPTKQGPMGNLVLNFPDSILEHLSSSPVHLAKIKNTINSNHSDFQDYFNGKMYLDDELVDAPFLCYLASSVFKWCGCAVGIEGRMEGLYYLMKAIKDNHEDVITFDEFHQKIKTDFGGDNIFCILMDSFDEFNLFEHGGSVYGSWLSNDGEVVFAHLEQWMKNREK